jgi:methylmalonyl-CoA/ethylmalonyl-CoA epimerase
MNMAIKRVDHIAIVVESLDAALATYHDALGLELDHVTEIPEQGVKAAFLPVGDSDIELLEPLNPESSVGKYLANAAKGCTTSASKWTTSKRRWRS